MGKSDPARETHGAARFSVSLPETLMRTLDRLRLDRGYQNRSEYVRDLLRAQLVKEEWTEQRGETVGVVMLVYDHDVRLLTEKLATIQHGRYKRITASLHVHLDEHLCLEILAVRGTPVQIKDVANSLLAVRGVRYGQLIPATSGKRLT